MRRVFKQDQHDHLQLARPGIFERVALSARAKVRIPRFQMDERAVIINFRFAGKHVVDLVFPFVHMRAD